MWSNGQKSKGLIVAKGLEKRIFLSSLFIYSSVIPFLPWEWSSKEEKELLTHRIMPEAYFFLV